MARYIRPAYSICFVIIGLFLLTLSADAGDRVALVIGNSAYTHANRLANPVNDAKDIAAALKDAEFRVILGLDLDKRGLEAKIREFSQALGQAETGVLFYAGHGFQYGGRNFLVPIDAQLESERDVDFETVNLDFVLKQMEFDRDGRTSIVFLDACRDNPLARNLARSMGTRSVNIGQGLAQVQAGVGTFIAYSTQPGNVALDGEGRNSPFSAALSRSIKEPGRNLTAMMIDVRKQVLAATSGRQVPWDHSALTGDFYFHGSTGSNGADGKPDHPGPDVQSLEARLKQLEEQLKTKSDPQQTTKLVRLEQVKERVRQLAEANQADQQRIFDTSQKYRGQNDPASRTQLNLEIGKIQRQMAQRGLEQKKLQGEIVALEAEIGTNAKGGTKKN